MSEQWFIPSFYRHFILRVETTRNVNPTITPQQVATPPRILPNTKLNGPILSGIWGGYYCPRSPAIPNIIA